MGDDEVTDTPEVVGEEDLQAKEVSDEDFQVVMTSVEGQIAQRVQVFSAQEGVFQEVPEDWDLATESAEAASLEASVAQFKQGLASIMDTYREELRTRQETEEFIQAAVDASRPKVVDDLLQAYETLLDEIIAEYDVSNWVRELIKRRRNQIQDRSVTVHAYIPGQARRKLEVQYVGDGEFDHWEVRS